MDTRTPDLAAPSLEDRAVVQPPAPGPTLGELYAVALAASEASRLAREAARIANEVSARLAAWGAAAIVDSRGDG